MFKIGDIIKPKQSVVNSWEENKTWLMQEFGVVIEEADPSGKGNLWWTVQWIAMDKRASYKFYEWQYFDIVRVTT